MHLYQILPDTPTEKIITDLIKKLHGEKSLTMYGILEHLKNEAAPEGYTKQDIIDYIKKFEPYICDQNLDPYTEILKHFIAIRDLAAENIDNAHNIDLEHMSQRMEEWANDMVKIEKFVLYPDED